MNAPTYDLRPAESRTAYLSAVGKLSDWVLVSGKALGALVEAYGEFVELNGREVRRSNTEYLLEALVLGVLWRARGREASERREPVRGLITELVRERRAGAAKRRDGSTAGIVDLSGSSKRGRIDPTLHEIEQLLDWMLASGEYDDELSRLSGWRAFLSTTPAATNREILRLVIAFAVRFEAAAERHLGVFTAGVEGFLCNDLPKRVSCEDTLQCSKRRVEYHLNMVGSDILNRAWRKSFLEARRHVLVMPGCARMRDDSGCRATVGQHELKCNHCMLGCIVSTATRQAERAGGQAFAVLHGSDFSRFLASEALAGGDVGIIGVACAGGLIGAGWRARAEGLAAQCVLLNYSGCSHWQKESQPTAFDLAELARILDRSDADECAHATPRVA